MREAAAARVAQAGRASEREKERARERERIGQSELEIGGEGGGGDGFFQSSNLLNLFFPRNVAAVSKLLIAIRGAEGEEGTGSAGGMRCGTVWVYVGAAV